jgi:hypothetical protein
MVKLPRDEHNFDKKGGDGDTMMGESRKEQSVMNASTKSPMKNLNIKGKNEVIKAKLDDDIFVKVEAPTFGMKEVNQPMAHLRANKELSSMHSQHKMGSSSIHGDLQDSQDAHHISNAPSQQFIGHSAPANDGISRVLSAETMNERAQKRTITEYL